MRISKDPKVRRQEILDTAMHLFYEKGYEATSMADIAKEMGVVQGLCYRYFDSKQTLYQEAMRQYVETISEIFVQILHDDTLSFQDRLTKMMKTMVDVEENAKYHEYFHKKGNEKKHDEMSMAIADYLLPHCLMELEKLEASNTLKLRQPRLLLRFILYGQIALGGEDDVPLAERLQYALHYINVLFDSEQQ